MVIILIFFVIAIGLQTGVAYDRHEIFYIKKDGAHKRHLLKKLYYAVLSLFQLINIAFQHPKHMSLSDAIGN